MSKIRSPSLLFGLCVIVFAGSWASVAHASNPELLPPQRFAIERFGIEDGLAHTTVWAVQQDRHGFLWFATESYLQRFDGIELRAFEHDPTDPHSLSESQVMIIYRDPKGRMWFSTRTRGINLWVEDEERFRRYEHDPKDEESLGPGRVMAMALGPDGHLWVATNIGLERLDVATGRVERFRHDPERRESLGHDVVLQLAFDTEGDLWVGDFAGYSRLRRGSESFEHFRHDPDDPHTISSNESGTIFVDSEGTVWLPSWSGMLDRYDRERDRVERLDPAPGLGGPRGIRKVVEDRRGDLWLLTAGVGLLHYDLEEGSSRRFVHDPDDAESLPSSELRDLAEDHSGVLWLATENGLGRWVRQKEQFEVWRKGPAGERGRLPGEAVSALAEDSLGRLWVGTLEGGLAVYEGDLPIRTWAENGGDSGLENTVAKGGEPLVGEPLEGMIRAILETEEGTLWIASRSGLWRRRGGTRDPGGVLGRRTVFERMIHSRGINALAAAEGYLFAGSGRGLYRLDPASGPYDRPGDRSPGEGARPVPLVEESARQAVVGQIYALATDPTLGLLVATEGGFFRVDPETLEVSEIGEQGNGDDGEPLGPSSLNLVALHRTEDGSWWLGSYGGGLNRWQPRTGKWTHYHGAGGQVGDGLPSDKVVGILEAADGALWLGTNNGVSRFDPRTESFRNFDFRDGLHGNISFIGTALHRQDGELVFGGPGGSSAFFPDRIRDDPRAPTMALTGISINDLPVAPGQRATGSPLEEPILLARELTLTHRHRTLQIEFAALHFDDPRRNRYAYRLEGWDEDWIETDYRGRRARYTNLDPGPYVFRVKASNKDGVWSEDERRLEIRVLPPPWKTGWAYAAYVASLIGLIVGFVHLQRRKLRLEQAINRQLRQVDRLKDEFLANTSHELRTPLQGITGLAESLLDAPEEGLSEEVRGDLALLLASSRRLGVLVDDLLDFAKLDQQEAKLDLRAADLHSLAQVVLTLTRPLVDEARVELVNAVDPQLPAVHADEHRLVQILHNLMGNAVKFTTRGSVVIRARLEGDGAVSDRWMRVEVVDSGIGIPADQQGTIFDPFRQVDGTIDRRFGGTGLGLAVSRQLVELHGGEIGVESTPGKGSTFHFTLPVSDRRAETSELLVAEMELPARADDQPRSEIGPGGDVFREIPTPATASGSWGAIGLGNGDPEVERSHPDRILVVDDEPINRRVLSSFLAAEGYEVDEAEGGAAALEKAAHSTYDLVLLDIMMPKVSGYDVCRELRKHHPMGRLPIIFLSAKIQSADVITGLGLGANDYLQKPISKAELLARIRPHLALLEVHRKLDERVGEKVSQLEMLGGLLPICSVCKNIRDDDGYWADLEGYISAHSEATFSHGICPDCLDREYRELGISSRGEGGH